MTLLSWRNPQMRCNKDCFNCRYNDCKNNELDSSDVKRQDEFDYELKHHSTPQQLRDAKLSYQRNRDKKLARNKEYYRTHRDKFREYDRRRRLEHPVSKEKRKEYYIRWRDKKKAEFGGDGLMGNVNRGKQFEDQIRKDFERVPGTYVTRLLDPMAGYAGVRNVCDFIIYKRPIQLLIECKTHYGKSLPFSCITQNQWNGLLAASATPGVKAGVLLWLVDCDATYYIPIGLLEEMKQGGGKSVSFKWLEQFAEIGSVIKINATKKRTLFTYDFEDLFDILDKHSN